MTERFKHTRNAIGMQFISYDEKEILIGTFADAKGVTNIVELLNTLNEENEQLKRTLSVYSDATRNDVKEIKELMQDIEEIQKENRQLKLLIKKVLETTPIEHSLALDLKNSIRELYK